MADYLTIDGGTTNTRISYVKNGRIIDTVKYGVGARDTLKDKNALKNVLRNGINEIKAKHNIDTVKAVIASGMITSDLGLISLDHTMAPAGLKELKETMVTTVFDDICDIPFYFVRGVKTRSTSLENADMMRGEEAEIVGAFRGAGVYVLPGSHSKIVTVDDSGKIISFKTMLTGEMIAAISSGTILKDALDLKCECANTEYLIRGCDYAKENGINEALFKVRILKKLFHASEEEAYGFFMGAVLYGEISQILKTEAKRYVICGKRQLREPTAALMRMLTDSEIITVTDEEAEQAAAIGAVKIFEY